MKNIIIGTAGHIDHGKTSLIKLLTNIDTDSLLEERKRGISINLGFAFFNLPSGKRAGVIDVPGHQKFIKNMLAGSTGIDIVLLVIACDEGIMPQTREHIDILSMLNINKGIVILTKRDLVDDEWYELVKSEIKDELSSTFLKDSPIIPFSSKTKEGYDELLKEIDNLIENGEGKSSSRLFRMPVDRSFTIDGFGTVVTGTIMSGKIGINDNVCIYPNNIVCKVRNIQVYEENVKEAYAGQRCAINLSNVKKEDVKRGSVISKEGMISSSYIVDSKFFSVKGISKNIVNRQRIRFFHGTSEIIGRMHILDKDEIEKGSEAYVQFHLEKPIISMKNDRYVVRSYSPMDTIGGGYIINPIASRYNKNKDKYLENLRIKEKEVDESYMSVIIRDDKDMFLTCNDICKKYLISEEDVLKLIKSLLNLQIIIEILDGVFIHKDNIDKILSNINDILRDYHYKNRFKIGYLKEELRMKLGFKGKYYDALLSYYEKLNHLKINGKYISLYDFQIKMDKDSEIMAKNIIDEYKKGKFIPPKIKDLNDKFRGNFLEIHDYLEESGVLYKVNSEMYLLKEDFIYAKDSIVSFIKSNGYIELKDAKEMLNSNRKYLLFLLEYLDEIKITKREEDKRVLY